MNVKNIMTDAVDEFFINFLEKEGYTIKKISYNNINLEDNDSRIVDIYYFSKSEIYVQIFDRNHTCLFEKECHNTPENILKELSNMLIENNVFTKNNEKTSIVQVTKDNSQCGNCIRPRICSLIDNEEIGWCEECSQCIHCNTGARIEYRVNWTVGCDRDPTRLSTEACKNCSEIIPESNDCDCSRSARMKTLQLYYWSSAEDHHIAV